MKIRYPEKLHTKTFSVTFFSFFCTFCDCHERVNLLRKDEKLWFSLKVTFIMTFLERQIKDEEFDSVIKFISLMSASKSLWNIYIGFVYTLELHYSSFHLKKNILFFLWQRQHSIILLLIMLIKRQPRGKGGERFLIINCKKKCIHNNIKKKEKQKMKQLELKKLFVNKWSAFKSKQLFYLISFFS